MSGLVALIHRSGRPADPDEVRPLLQAAPYRGPDGTRSGAWGPVALGYAKLAVTPEDQLEDQPVVSSRTGCVLVAEARLDNREELRSRLPDRPSPSIGDAALILHAYETWAGAAPEYLLGDFAFIVWDPRRYVLVCARDTSGQRVLFYRANGDELLVASEIHQLLQDPSVPVRPNEERIHDFLVPLNVYRNEKDQAVTFYKGVSALPAGCVLTAGREDLRLRRYWNFPVSAEIHYRNEHEYADHYRDLLFEAVRSRLRSSRPVGALLSGGLDSSSIVGVAQELYRIGRASDQGFVTFSTVFDGMDCDERSAIVEIQEKYGFDARYLPHDGNGGRLQLEPSGFLESPDLVRTDRRDAIGRAASRAGVRALLTGDVADSCVAGSWFVFDSLLRRGRVWEFWRYFQAYRRLSDEPLRTTVVIACLAPLFPLTIEKLIMTAYVRRRIRRLWHRLLPAWMPSRLREELGRRHLHLCEEQEGKRRFSSFAREEEFRLLYPPEINRVPAPWSIELSMPFADRRLHEFLLHIPPEVKFAPAPDSPEFHPMSKQLVRRAMGGILPERIRTKVGKVNFDGVFRNEVRHFWPVYEAAFGPKARPEVAERGYVDRAGFWARLEEVRDGASANDLIYLMRVVGLETWLRALKLPRPQLVSIPSPSLDGA